MTIIVNILLFIAILGVIVFVHEGGHFLFAKLTGVYVYEFAIGMGPKIWGFKKGETEYNLRAIPIGGFCQLAGENPEDDDEEIPKDRRLYAKKAWQRFLIMVFGPMNNFILAVILLFFIAIIWGGTTMKPVISSVEVGSAAEEIGIEEGDKIVNINGHKVYTSDDVSLFLALSKKDKKNTIVVLKESGEKETYKVQPREVEEEGEKVYRYGIVIKQEPLKGLGGAFVYTFKKTCSIFRQMFVTVSSLFTGGIRLNQLSGPVGIYSVVGEQRSAGIASLLYLTALLSINVGFINLLPIPAFDGGHILFIVIEKIKGSPVNPELEGKIHTVFLILLMILMVFITINDVVNLFH